MQLLQKYLVVIMLSWFLTLTGNAQDIDMMGCVEYAKGVCIRCTLESHMFKGICYKNILGCIEYTSGRKCIQCSTDFVLKGATCVVVDGVTLTSEEKMIQRYGDMSNPDPGDRYGQSNFMIASLVVVKNWPTFIALNKFMLSGQYSHFISKVTNPIFSVHYYTTKDTFSYKLLYEGSGGGLLLCIADVHPNMSVILRSLTPISSSSVVDYCQDYNTVGKCLSCSNAYHLENMQCYFNMEGCIKYIENICIECLGSYFLIENRCVSDCISIADTKSVLYYENNINKSTLELYYQIPIYQFYTIQTYTTIQSIKIGGGQIIMGGTSIIGGSQMKIEGNGLIGGGATIITDIQPNYNANYSIINIEAPIQQQQRQTIIGINTANSSAYLIGGRILQPYSDLNCAMFDSVGQCNKCSYFFFKNQQNVCQQVNPLCATYNEQHGNCQSCYPSYLLQSGQCIIK